MGLHRKYVEYSCRDIHSIHRAGHGILRFNYSNIIPPTVAIVTCVNRTNLPIVDDIKLFVHPMVICFDDETIP